jgi:hypothetical protein
MEKQIILKQEYKITNQFDEQMAIESLKSQLSSAIFKELINNEKQSITLTFTLDVIE